MSSPVSQWAQGRAVLQQLIAEGRVERVPASRAQADLLIEQARNHLGSAYRGRGLAG